MRAYLQAHPHGVAASEDLFAALDRSTGDPAGAVARSFVERAGVPLVSAELRCSDVGPAEVRVVQSR